MFPLLYMWLTGWHVYTYIYISIQVQQVYSHKYIYIFIYLFTPPKPFRIEICRQPRVRWNCVSVGNGHICDLLGYLTNQLLVLIYICIYIYMCQLFNIKWNTFRYLYIYMHICIDKSKRDAGVGTASVFTARSASNLCCMSWKAAAV